MKRVGVLMVLVACTDTNTIEISPILERPTDEDADALPELTQIRIAIDGTALDSVFDRGEDIVLDDVPLAPNLVLRLDGFIDGQGIAVGRTCPFSLADDNRPSPRLYFSQVVRTGLLEQPAGPRARGMAVTLADDTILMVGGEGATTIERYDPRAATVVEVDHDPFDGRVGAAVALFEDGRPAIIGGLVGGTPATTSLLISPTGTVEEVPDTAVTLGRSNLTATSLADGQILITGGRDAAGLASSKIVRMRTNASDIVTLELVNSAALAHARERHVVTPLGDGGASLLITGGNDNLGVIAQSELYRPSTDEAIALESPKFDLKFPRTGHHAALLPDESVVIVGGVDAAGNPVRTIERLSLIDGVITTSQQLPVGAPAIDFSLITLPDGSILMAGGRERAGAPAQNAVFLILFDAATDNVQLAPRDELAIARIAPQLAVLCDGTVLISGGTEQLDLLERFNPNVRPKL